MMLESTHHDAIDSLFMRTTISLAEDVAAAVDRLRRDRGIGLSEAVNELARRGLAERRPAVPFEQQTSPMTARIDVDDIGDALEALEGPASR